VKVDGEWREKRRRYVEGKSKMRAAE